MLIYGFHPVREALRHRPHEVQLVLVSTRRGGSRRDQIEHLCRRHGVTCQRTPEREIERLAPGVHNGFVAEVAGAAGQPAADQTTAGDPELVVLLEDVQDPRNLGAILRVCDGAGVGRVLLRDRGTAPVSPAAVKTSAGAAEWLEIERVTNSAMTIERLKADGYWVYGADAAGEAPWEIDLSGKLVLCFGGEEKGLRARTRKLCDRLVGLPMRGRIESLNVATATAAVLFEAVRQRG